MESSENNNFRNFWNFQTFGKPSFRNFELYWTSPNFFWTFPNFSELFRTFPNFFWTFWLKNSYFTYFFWNFWNLHTFLNNFRTFSELKFPNFFRNFFAKILCVRKFRFFPKNFRTSTAELFRNPRKQKVQKILSNAGP